MNTKFRALFSFIALLMVTSLACSTLNPPPTATATSIPTNTPEPTPTSAIASIEGAEFLDEKVYTHSTGAFSFNPPKGWEVSEFSDYSATIKKTDDVIFYIAAINTGHELTNEEFKTYVNEEEEFFYSWRDDFEETKREVKSDINLFHVEKTYTQDGAKYFASSAYQKFGPTIFIIEVFGLDEEIQNNPEYFLSFNAFYASVTAEPDEAAKLPVYQEIWTTSSTKGNFEIGVPIGWDYRYYDQAADQNLIQEEFVSPDGHAVIEIFTVDDGTVVTMDYLSDFTMQVVNDNYSDNDAKIVDEGEEGGFKVIEWTSAGKAFNGFAYPTIKENTSETYVVIVFWEAAYDDTYKQFGSDLYLTLTVN